MNTNRNYKGLGRLLKQQRVMIPLTLRELAAITGISSSYLGRIEKGGRFPSSEGKVKNIISNVKAQIKRF